MASRSGNSSGSSRLQNSGSEEDLQQLMDQRKRKRMQSNRESARRSRMRKQKHMDDLMAQLTQLRKENNQILTNMNITTQHFLNVEAENSVLRAQMVELSQRLDSLNDILNYMNSLNGVIEAEDLQTSPDSFMNNNPWNLMLEHYPFAAPMARIVFSGVGYDGIISNQRMLSWVSLVDKQFCSNFETKALFNIGGFYFATFVIGCKPARQRRRPKRSCRGHFSLPSLSNFEKLGVVGRTRIAILYLGIWLEEEVVWHSLFRALSYSLLDGTVRALHRNVIYSPSWSFRWDNRRRVAGEIEDPSCRLSCEISRDSSMEMKGGLGLDGGTFSGGRSPSENFGTPMSQKSPVHEGQGANPITPPSDLLMAGIDNAMVQSSIESPEIVNTSAPKLSFSVPSSSSFSMPTANLSSSRTRSLPANSTQSRRAHRSPGHQLLSNDLTIGSQGGSSDGWSMRTFSELVASSQRERWSFDSECLDSGRGKISESSSRFSYSPSVDLQTCGACSKLLIEKSAWSSQKIFAGNELSVIAVLVCGHVYHAECLETMTPEADQYDPSCPVCMVGEKQVLKMSGKALKAAQELKSRSNKISRNRVVDSYLDAGFDVLDCRKNSKREGKFPKLEPSSSARNSFAKPFLKRHFSLGSKCSRSLSENDSSRKRGFWARYRKD
ncbi:hypothetical protein F0562_027194 [Nyssa sinensis]|uniref:RING-type domain-containing protein n=1 Tax=Nyssa sinensis TaxID=561372 RepID=A0A5J5B5P4_9ASTE|nr:hypothetical protein F0562_027194 [Nyssa sinensis]